MLNLNRASLSLEPVNVALNDTIERAAATTAELPRPYLGASIIGDNCARKTQYSWWCKPVLAARTREIFDRGHYFEERARRLLVAAGFKFAPPEALAFTAAGGALRGHADGIILHGPDLPGAYLIFPLIWEHKAVNAKNWRAIERDGLERAFPQYAVQVALYQAYLNITTPVLFTVTNADLASGYTSSCRSTPSARSSGPTAPSTSSRRRAPGSCFRVAMTIPRTGIAGCVPIGNAAGGRHEQARRQQAAQARQHYWLPRGYRPW